MTTNLRATLAEMRAVSRERYEKLATLPDAVLKLPGVWRNQEMDVGFLFLHLGDHEEEHTLQLAGMLDRLGHRKTHAQRLLGAAEATRGLLLGALVGLTDADLDLAPESEWSLRQLLAHVIQVEQSYTQRNMYAVEMHRAGQPYVWPAGLPQVPEPDVSGPLSAILDLLDAAREHVLHEQVGLSDEDLRAPCSWSFVDVNVDFRLMRFARHEREHTLNILKWRRQIGRERTEVQETIGLAWEARGRLHEQLAGLSDDDLDRPVDAGEGSETTIRELLAHVVGSQRYLNGQIEMAMEGKPT